MEEEKDILVFEDEDGEEIMMEILDYFSHEDEEYALLLPVDEECESESCHSEEQELYVMKVIVDGDMEEFQPVEDQQMESIIKTIEEIYYREDQ